jgi:hypothetical protein
MLEAGGQRDQTPPRTACFPSWASQIKLECGNATFQLENRTNLEAGGGQEFQGFVEGVAVPHPDIFLLLPGTTATSAVVADGDLTTIYIEGPAPGA